MRFQGHEEILEGNFFREEKKQHIGVQGMGQHIEGVRPEAGMVR